YNQAVARLTEVHHPGLRAVLAGGCDPVDGMPFVVIEWIEGVTLASVLEHSIFTPVGAIAILDKALEVSAALTQVLGEEAVWVDTSPAMIIVNEENPAGEVAFCLAPMKWLGADASKRGLRSLAELAEDLLGWRGKRVPDQAGDGMGGWLRCLRANSNTLTLSQVRESLVGFMEELTAEPIMASGPAPRQPVILKRPATKRQPAWLPLGILLTVAMVGAGWWFILHPLNLRRSKPVAATAVRPPVARTTQAPPAVTGKPSPAAPLPVESKVTATGERVYQVRDSPSLLSVKSQEVTVEGALHNIRSSDSGKTLYLEFVDSGSMQDVRGYFITKNLPPDVSEQALKPLLGKRIQITGEVKMKQAFKQKWPELLLKDRTSIKEMK
ncbi:MAG: hypothetical protein WCO57_10840, partial [Verrucomicrobiota bacterium]